jgi:hypothetical protein
MQRFVQLLNPTNKIMHKKVKNKATNSLLFLYISGNTLGLAELPTSSVNFDGYVAYSILFVRSS